jgi:hypothetical protein
MIKMRIWGYEHGAEKGDAACVHVKRREISVCFSTVSKTG